MKLDWSLLYTKVCRWKISVWMSVSICLKLKVLEKFSKLIHLWIYTKSRQLNTYKVTLKKACQSFYLVLASQKVHFPCQLYFTVIFLRQFQGPLTTLRISKIEKVCFETVTWQEWSRDVFSRSISLSLTHTHTAMFRGAKRQGHLSCANQMM